ncbi:hypothetical protein NUW58_g2020 [Xylaria curta]|uniref:Uncharacterized protein n=1 Tax=Xylaria curta TaxID=42375 RepID=A0ACC1PIX4_9PEZI|nr:hypothetical protein NUW58_g2020 [Xylaria curta]
MTTVAGPNHSLQWAPPKNATFERDLDDFERFYHFISKTGQGCPNRLNWRSTVCARITTALDDLPGRLRNAWKNARLEFPIIAAYVENDRFVYKAADEKDLELWMQETFNVLDTERTARRESYYTGPETRRMLLHFLPHTQEVFVQGPHTHIDGIGLAVLLRFILQSVAGAEESSCVLGEEVKNLLPPLAVTSGVPTPTPAQKKAFNTAMQGFVSNFAAVHVHSENKGAPARTTKIQWLIYDEADTKAIAARSKELGFSVTACLQAALSRTARIHGQVDSSCHATMAIYDGRGYVDGKFYPHDRLVGPHVFAMPAVYPISESFQETALAAKEVLASFKEDDLVRTASGLWVDAMNEMLSTPPPPGAPVAADLQLSSIGVLDKFFPPLYKGEDGQTQIEVDDLWMSLDILYPNVAVDAWTFRGKLNIELMYNEAYHRDSSITLITSLIHEQLTQGLGLDLKYDARKPGEEDFVSRS